MKIKVAPTVPPNPDVLVIPVFDEEKPCLSGVAALPARLRGQVLTVLASGRFTPKAQAVERWVTAGSGYIVLAGMGKGSAATADTFRKSAGTAVNGVGGPSVVCLVPDHGDPGEAARAMAQGIALAEYRYKAGDGSRATIQSVTLVPRTPAQAPAFREAAGIVESEAAGLKIARDLVNTPANDLGPARLAEEAEAIASRRGYACKVFGPSAIASLKLGGLLAVASGSASGPRLAVLDSAPRSTRLPVVAVVGKGITFDSGGISLKNKQDLHVMKCDMAGAAAVLGAVAALDRERLPVRLVGILPIAENLPGGRAYRPGDVVRMASGQTVEIISTDAEGRLLLADALHFAARFKPSAIIDVATLTGACVVALGDGCIGVMGNDPGLCGAVLGAGRASGETAWELPLIDEYDALLQSDVADMKGSTGSPEGGAIVGGLFLRRFAAGQRWVHLDIAGPAWNRKKLPHLAAGATGAGVRLLAELLRGWAA